MSETNKVPAFRSMPAVAGLNNVKGFEPTKFIRIAKGGGLALDLKYKKLWFRLACPDGVIKPVALKITEQVAIIEARVYRSKADAEPFSSFIATKYATGKEGKLYIEAAQYEAEDQALLDAGFGIQFCDVAGGTSMDRLVASDVIAGANMPSVSAVQRPVAQVPTAMQPQVAKQAVQAKSPAAVQPPVAEPTPAAKAPAAVQPVVAEPAPAAESPVAVQPPVTEPAPAAESPAAVQPPVVDPAPATEQPSVVEPVAVAETPERVQRADSTSIQFPGTEMPPVLADITNSHLPFTKDMPVHEICAAMTMEEALTIVVDAGTCKNWTLAEVLQRKPASLKWYNTAYSGDNNLLRAGAQILLNTETNELAAG